MVKGKKPIKKPQANAKAKKANATTRSTGGPGFNFEDNVSAWLLLKMLRGEPIPGIEASGFQLQLQTTALGWDIDDLLVTATSNDAEKKQLAISSKGNVQVTSSGLPNSFIISAWSLWQKSRPFQREQDGIALATRGYNAAFNSTWQDFKDWCKDGDTASALAKINATQKHRKFFDSIKNPLTSDEVSISDEEIVHLIRHLHVFPLGFQIDGLNEETNSIARCRDLLESGDLAESKKLWQLLVAKAEEARVRGGTIRLSDLLNDLRKVFALKNHPDFSASWDALSKITADYKEGIQVSLPNGHALQRVSSSNALGDNLKDNSITIVYGDSGCGKSALVKTVLDENFSDAQQVWLGPEEVNIILSEAKRSSAGLSRTLLETLINSTKQKNVLVIDSAERLSPESAIKIKKLISSLSADNSENPQWRILILGQTEAWSDARLQDLSGASSPKFLEVMEITQQEASAALSSSAKLSWLSSHEEAVSVLRNLKTLYWVMQAQEVFQKPDIGAISLTTIADKLWEYWTDGKTQLQSLLMKMGKKEASFQRSFPISEMDGDDAKAFDEAPKQLPLQRNSRNCIEFQHDLAADWARFQSLKGVSHNTAKWAPLAKNPLWHNALRMLGQFLLRESKGDGKTAWDIAFEEAEKSKEAMPLAADILLDALCLDPLAGLFLEQRADLLFENHGKRLNRLLRRFQHIATRPAVPEVFSKLDPSLNLYLEAQHRLPVYGRWPGIANFLTNHKNKVANLMSPTVAKLCETWLTGTPQSTPESTIIFRKEFSEIAIATVRALQIEQGKGSFFIHEGQKQLYSAAFQAASDLPDEVAKWALEMSQRRPYRKDISEALKEFSKQRIQEHEQKLKDDPEYRKRQERISSMPSHIPRGRKLPAWPLGPRKRVEKDFSDVCTGMNALQNLMKVRPEAALEILLANIIEDSPEEEYSPSSRMDFDLGLKFDHSTYPSAYWKSTFLTFLHLNPEIALGGLIELINFCVDRWEHEYDAEDCPKIILDFEDGSSRVYKGDARVFDWAQNNSIGTGQLSCALQALEKWICLQIEKGVDVAPVISRLLRETNSVSILGVLINVGKFSTPLFSGPLLPLLGNPDIYTGDKYSLDALPYRFDISWARAGDYIFNMAKEWIYAPYRQVSLLQIAVHLLLQDKRASEYLANKTRKWNLPENRKRELERRILIAELNADNYAPVQNETGQEGFQLIFPADLEKDIQAFQQENSLKRQTLVLPMQCENIINGNRELNDEEEKFLTDALAVAENDENPDTKKLAQVAISSALIVKASSWLERNPEISKKAEQIVRNTINGIGDTVESLRKPYFGNTQDLTFAARAVFQKWMKSGYKDKECESDIVRVLTSRDKSAVSTLMHVAHANKSSLGGKWWRLLQIGVLWSALSHLMPRYDDPSEIEAQWNRRLAKFRTLEITDDSNPSSVNLIKLSEKVERLEKLRLKKKEGYRIPKRRHYFGIDTHILQDIFSWLVNQNAETKVYDEHELYFIKELWNLEAWLNYEDLEEDDDEHSHTLDTFGYVLLENLARIASLLPANETIFIWKPLFELGSNAHYAIRHFLDAWFVQFSRQGNSPVILQTWKNMLEYALGSEKWISGRRWYYGEQLLRQLLGMHSEAFLIREDRQSVVLELKDYYKQWALKHLSREEDNITAFCRFLGSKVGAVIRMEGIVWLKESLTADAKSSYGRRDHTGNALVELFDTSINENAKQIAENPEVREALVSLVADLVAKQIPAALALQERIRRIVP